MASREEERARMAREVKQRLESLGRAGVTHVPKQTGGARRAETAKAEEAAEKEPRLQASDERGAREHAATPRPVIEQAAPRSLFATVEAQEGLGPRRPRDERISGLEVIAQEVAGCPRCPVLAGARTKTVPGEGDPEARLMFLGEAPGQEEDRTGRPFVGRAGQLLTDMITKGMGLTREQVYIANTIKCRPPENRVPLPDEQANCREYLDRQLSLIQPEFLCLLGKTAALAMIDMPPNTTMAKLRGRWFDYRGIRTLVTFHPAYLLRNPAAKKDTWEDLKVLMAEMGLKPPGRSAT